MNTHKKNPPIPDNLSLVNSFFQYVQDVPHSKEARILLLSCSDLSGFQGILPEGMECEILSPSGSFFDFPCGGSQKDLLWRDLEDEVPPDSQVYDIIFILDWLEYCSWPRWAVQKLFNLLKISGQFVLLVENAESGFFRFRTEEEWKKQTGPYVKPDAEKCPAQGDIHVIKKTCFTPVAYPASRVQSWLQGVGFDIYQMQQYNIQGKLLSEPIPAGKRRPKGFLRKRLVQWRLSKKKTWVLYNCRKRQTRSDRFKEQISSRPDFSEIFEKRYSEMLTSLENWLDRYPRFRTNSVLPLDRPEKGATVLVLSPHPDDEVIGCGGAIQYLVESGYRVVILHLTDGSNCHSLWNKPDPYRRQIRLQEARQAADLMGAECLCWGLPDGKMRCTQDPVEKLHKLLADLQPSWIFTPFINDPLPDHLACNQLLRAALQYTNPDPSQLKLFCYEISSFVPANVYFRVDSRLHRKEQLLLLYQSGLKPVDYMDFCLWRHAYSSLHSTSRQGFVESFFMLCPEEYLSLEPVTSFHKGTG